MRHHLGLILIFALALTCYADDPGGNGNGNGNGKGRARGTTTGAYQVQVAGRYAGSGSGTVSGSSLSLSASVKFDGQAAVPLACNNLALDNSGHFNGTGLIGGSACTIEGRIDLPTGQDFEQNDKQAYTGRISATLEDAQGKMARVVGIQIVTPPSGTTGGPP